MSCRKDRRTTRLHVTLLGGVLLFALAAAQADVNEHQKKRIRAAAPDKARVVPKKPRRVLIWNTPFMEKSPHKGYTIPHSAYAFTMLGEKTGAYVGQVSDDQCLLAPDKLKTFDAIVLNNSCGAWIRPTREAAAKLTAYGPDQDAVEKVLRKSLLDFVKKGGGVFAFHYALGANRHWPAYHQLLGAGMWGHPWNEEVGVSVEEPNHPLCAVFGSKNFRIADEIFQFREPYDRAKVRVLLSLDTTSTNMTVKWIHRKDNDFALAWVRSYGKGRVFYSAIGHRTEIWWNPMVLQFYLDAIQFVAGDIKAPTAPRGQASIQRMTKG